MRVVSLVPEAAEILAAIDDGADVVGVDGADELRRALAAGRPELIVTSETAAGGGVPRHEVRRIVRGLGARVPIYALEPRSLGDILSDVKTLGDATGRQREARVLIESLRARIDAVSLRAAQAVAERGPRFVACLLALDPPLAAGWWQAELIGLAGGSDVFNGAGRPPRPTSWAEIESAGAERVVLLTADEVVDLAASPDGRAGRHPPGLAAPPTGEPLARPPGGEGRSPQPLTPGLHVVDVLERLAAALLPDRLAEAAT